MTNFEELAKKYYWGCLFIGFGTAIVALGLVALAMAIVVLRGV